MKRVALTTATLLLAAAAAQAGTIRGNLLNGTTDQPGFADSVRLLDMAGGMDQIATLTDVTARFEFNDVPARTGAPYLIQVQSQGVLYSQPVQLPDQEAAVDFYVYDATESLDDVVTTMYNLVFQRDGDVMNLMQLLEFDNRSDPPVAVWRDEGPITVELPPGILGNPQVQVTTTSGMPLRQELLETDEEGVFTVGQALKPGVTRLVVESRISYEDASLEWSGQAHHAVQVRTLLISPDDIAVHGTELVRSSRELPNTLTGYAVYEGAALAPGDQFEIHLEGGSEQFVDPHAGLDMSGGGHSEGDGHDHGDGRTIQEVAVRANQLSASRALIMSGLGLTLLLGLATGLQRAAPGGGAMSRELAQLEDRYLAGKLDRDAFLAERERLRSHRSAP